MVGNTYPELLDWLFQLEARKGMDFKLERIELVLRELGHPERKYPVVHIAGTNGKGSVAAMLHAMARAAGLDAGLYTSPHLVRFTERIRVGDREIAPEEVVECAKVVYRAATARGIELTFFEFTTVLAFLYFAECRVPLAVVEVGLGGRLDATNVVAPEVAVITSIGLDHQEFLGDTIEAIAWEKAGIIKERCPVVAGPLSPVARRVIAERARQQNAPVWWAGKDFGWEGDDRCWSFRGLGVDLREVALGLRGRHQCENAAVAVAAAQLLPDSLRWSAEVCRAGLEQVRWPGRLEIVSREPLIVLDGAHNGDGVRAVVAALPGLVEQRRVRLLFGVMADKDWRDMIQLLAPVVCEVVVTRVPVRRSADPSLVAAAWRELVPARVEENVEAALATARAGLQNDQALLVTGSLFLVGAVRQVLERQQSGFDTIRGTVRANA
ncbi:MAG: bifunctional folylpolyglutamate synthase/dihydrofolate synthase [Candidatus Binatia bacterium]|nr:MAG: bifunctional folylpolyglutamate synthase/dihydrofolate synthase [Candidatus Binatia bacterium]